MKGQKENYSLVLNHQYDNHIVKKKVLLLYYYLYQSKTIEKIPQSHRFTLFGVINCFS